MAVNLVRFTLNGGPRWGVAQANGVAPLAGDYPTTAALIERGEDDWRAAAGQTPSFGLEAIELLSPVTTPCRVFCQGANYRRHMIESGLDPDAKAFNMFFMKSDASISPAIGSVRPPCHVKLLFREPDAADHPQLLGRRQFASPHNGAEEAEAAPSRPCARRAPGPRHAGGMDESFNCRRSARQGEGDEIRLS
jgi:hypothetical protein